MTATEESEVRHPYYSYTLKDARLLGATLCSHRPCDPRPQPVDDRRALEAIEHERRTCGHNWITGRVAAELLEGAISGKPKYTT